MDGIRLIGFMCLLSFCGCLDGAIIGPNEPVEQIIQSTWNNLELNSDLDLTTPEIIEKAGYSTETHTVITEDGYILTLHRIPGGNGSLPVLLVHGSFNDDSVWITLGKGKALDDIINLSFK
ncbi:lysosomal acid lipase/cholesteryl ester hydrolase-like [Nylanderia fulva]|uniref:lysosomal acid lipase/cholesteryl ester hydrolase-like n=1 Tax=Nylanderia fulva TaxID=613905 RepID=UPI0010FB6960|nr:lysosomal acid lipase/cholesteryl ester hydrolase-like [Nylanderia fulva]